MDIDIKKLARQQYLNYFKIWFIVLGIMAVLTVLVFIGSTIKEKKEEERLKELEEIIKEYRENHQIPEVVRGNLSAPTERVYDNADVLSASEEESLRELIARVEEKIQCDVVLVTVNQPVEYVSAEEMIEYNYRYDDWNGNMRDLADDFYDYNNFGFDVIGGDGILLLDNWYGGQEGSWLSTSGKVYEQFGDSEINYVLDEVNYGLDEGEYEAYAAYVYAIEELMFDEASDVYRTPEEKEYERIMNSRQEKFVIYGVGSAYILGAIGIPLFVAVIYILVNLNAREGKVTTNASTYVDNGRAKVNVSTDKFIRKTVSTRIIQSSSSSGGGSGGGRGGSHTSRSGRSHGGGGRRR